jgi:hypothetical protein
MLNPGSKQKKHRLLDAFSFVGVEGFEPRGGPSPILCLLADAARAEATFDLKQKKHRLLDTFSFVGVEGFEPPTLCL